MSTRRVHVPFSRGVAVLSAFALALLAGSVPAAADTAMVTLAGHITGPDALGVDGAQVRVGCSNTATPLYTTAAPDGSWSVQVPQGASCYVYASKLDAYLIGQYYGTTSWSPKYLTFAADTAGVDLQLVLGGNLAGKVTVPAGYSTVGWWAYAGTSFRRAEVGADGTYLIQGLPIGTYKAFVIHLSSSTDLYADPEYSSYTVTAGATTSGIDFTLRVGASITGLLTTSDGRPAAGVRVDALTAGNAVADWALTDGGGRYTLTTLPAGPYTVQFSADGLINRYYRDATTSAAATTVDLTDGMVATADQTLLYYSSVGGHVVDGRDAPVPGVAVSLEPVSGGASTDAGNTDTLGMFHGYLPALTGGSYLVRFVPPAGSGYAATYFGGPTRAHATPITLTAQGSEVVGLHAVLPPASTPGRYVAQPPTRVLDTRLTFNGALRAGEYRTIDLDPSDTTGMTGAVLNITTTRTACPATYLSAGPTLSPSIRPGTSVVNARWFADVPNMVTVQVTPGGLVTLYSDGCDTDVVVDLEGYYTANGGAGYVPAPSPIRVVDTRTTSSALRAGETRRVDLSGVVPQGAVAAMVTLTSTRATTTTYLSAFPTGSTAGTGTSVVNAIAGADIANSAPVQLAADGSISVYNNAGQVDVVVDVVGWYTATGGAAFWPLEPARTPSSGSLGGGQTRLVASPDERIPVDAVAVALNLTTTHPTAWTSYLVAYPAGGERPATSNGNARAGIDVANGTIVALSGGGYRVYNNAGTVTALEDVFGYFAPAT
ncbi:MAG TPA: carboxypeptidase-like regulatory domain-containing protein [Propionicimonas sp.]|jgi:hypothetical protein